MSFEINIMSIDLPSVYLPIIDVLPRKKQKMNLVKR